MSKREPTSTCPVCDHSGLTRNMGNHLRQKHKLPVPSRQQNATAWARDYLRTRRLNEPTPTPPIAPILGPEPISHSLEPWPSARQVVVTLAKSLWGDDIPTRHLAPILELEAAIDIFLARVDDR